AVRDHPRRAAAGLHDLSAAGPAGLPEPDVPHAAGHPDASRGWHHAGGGRAVDGPCREGAGVAVAQGVLGEPLLLAGLILVFAGVLTAGLSLWAGSRKRRE